MKIKLVKTKKLEDVPKILREKSKEVEKITPQILDLIEKMKKIMKEDRLVKTTTGLIKMFYVIQYL